MSVVISHRGRSHSRSWCGPMIFGRFLAAAIAAATVLLPASSFACAVCMGDSTTQAAGAINAAIFLMLGLIGSILTGLGGFAFYLVKRANAPLPPELDLGSDHNEEEESL